MAQNHDAGHVPQDRPANRLQDETSPYLLQHAHNPVDWYPWGPEALERAKAEDRPIFLSIGYSACHWCHVMEHESFENPEIAGADERALRQHQGRPRGAARPRPDLHDAVQAMTGHGGWPMSVFLTPDLKPFFGGTYFPPTDSRGMPGFPRVLLERAPGLGRAAATRSSRSAGRDDRAAPGDRRAVPGGDGRRSTSACSTRPRRALLRAFDPLHGGFGQAPKFPHPMDLRVLLRQHAADRRRPRPARGPRTRSTRWPAAGSTTTSAAASPATRPTTAGSSPTSRRCSTTTPCWPRSTSKPTRSTGDAELRPRRPRDARLRPRPDDRPRRGLLLDRGRRQRGRGGQVLRLVAGRDRRGPRAPSGRRRSPTSTTSPSRATGRARTSSTCPSRSTRRPSCSAATRRSCATSSPRTAPGCWRRATAGSRRARTRRS